MKLLVTGSEGSLMQWVIPLLRDGGHEILGVDNFARYGELKRQRDYEFERGDLNDADFTTEMVAQVDGVVQAAALIFGVGGFHRRPADILSGDVGLHGNVLRAMRDKGVEKIAYISSSMVYERCQRHPTPEEDAFEAQTPATDYGLSKLVGERLVIAFALQYGIKYTIWRPFNIITPYEVGEDEIGTSHVFADYIRNIVDEKRNPLPIIGDGEQIRCFTWIGDVARGVAENSFGNAAADDETFNLGNPEPVTMRELARLIHAEARNQDLLPADAGELEFETVEEFADDVKVRVPAVDKARECLGWEPTRKVADSVAECLRIKKERDAD